MTFCIRSAQDELQSKIDEIYEGLQGVTTLVDDILLYSKTREKLYVNLRKVLTRSHEKLVKFNPDKLTVVLTEVPYFGHVLSSNQILANSQLFATWSSLAIA